MDLWVVAAATGAGYIAKYWRNLSGEKDSLAESSSLFSINGQSDLGTVLHQIPDRPLPLQRLARKWLDGDLSSNKEDVWEDKFQEMDRYVVKNEDYNVGPLSSMPTIFGGREIFRENVDAINGKPLRSRRPRMDFVKPVEEYGFNGGALSSPSIPTMMPLLVTDACRTISRTTSDSNDLQFDGGKGKIEKGNASMFGLTRSMRLPRKPEKRGGKGQTFSTSRQTGDGMLLLFFGITIGVMANVVASESEVDNLNELLKRAENLVRDLQEDLDMKDMLTVMELAREDNQLSRTNSPASFMPKMVSSSSKAKPHESIEYDRQIATGQMTEIEAELEAELERLELNMKTSTLESISDFVEIDPDLEADMVKGGLKVEVVGRNLDCPSDSDHDKSGTTGKPTENANYTVSPWELTLRLHELIESRLKSRIEELETALRSSQSRPNTLESLPVTSLSGIAHSEVESLSTSDSSSLPLGISLSGQALDSCNEADGQISWRNEPNLRTAVAFSNGDGAKQKQSRVEVTLSEGQNLPRWEDWTSSRESNEVGQREDEDEDDAFGKLLINQIVEQHRSGSSVP